MAGQTARPNELKCGGLDVKSPDDECGLGAVGLKRHVRCVNEQKLNNSCSMS